VIVVTCDIGNDNDTVLLQTIKGETVFGPQSQETNTINVNEVGDDTMMMHIKQWRQNKQEKTTGGEKEVQKKLLRF
jgi:hypothetical protein